MSMDARLERIEKMISNLTSNVREMKKDITGIRVILLKLKMILENYI